MILIIISIGTSRADRLETYYEDNQTLTEDELLKVKEWSYFVIVTKLLFSVCWDQKVRVLVENKMAF